jgi:hypothetical protein
MAEDNNKRLEFIRALKKEQDDLRNSVIATSDVDEKRRLIEQLHYNLLLQSNEQQQIRLELVQQTLDLTEAEKKEVLGIVEAEKEYNNQLQKAVDKRQKAVDAARGLVGFLKQGWDYLQQSDKVIRQTILNLGMSGQKAEMMRASFEQSLGYVTRLGGTIEDVQGIMTGYAEETGRARVLSAEMVKDITEIGKGTGLGIEQATRLGAQFEIMGFDARTTNEYVQGVVDTTERMGVNTTKVLKSVNDNFKKLNTYTFQQGVKGFAQMAAYAEKFRVDIGQALNAADVSRTLEGAIDLAANLQIMGGEFAKTDPFEMLFLSRNDPAKFTEKITEMTKGVVTFRKMADGSFEKFISPADRDRLAAVAKSLGMEASALTEMAERQADIQKMRQQMAGMGLSTKEKEILEGAAIFNKENGRFEVQLGGQMRDIATLTKEQANSFAKEQVLLKDRAKQAMTFDETFKATINLLKASLLPILKAVNGLLIKVQPLVDKLLKFVSGSGGWAKAFGILVVAAGAWKTASFLINKATDNWVKTGSVMAKQTGAPTTKFGTFMRGSTTATETTGGAAKGISGKAMAGVGAGVGAAALGVGAGIGAAAAGISLLAKAMSGLDKDQAEVLKSIVNTIGLFVGIGAVAAGVMMIFSTAAAAAAPGLYAFGGAIALVGAGVGIAAAGIGVMGMGLAKLVTASKDAGKDMPIVAKGIVDIAAAMATAGLTLGGGIGMAIAVNAIGKSAFNISKVSTSLASIKTSLSGGKEDFIAVKEAIESISKMNVRGGGALADLANMMRKPLKVEFADKKLAMVSDITLNIDGDKFMRKVVKIPAFVQKQYDFKTKGVS